MTPQGDSQQWGPQGIPMSWPTTPALSPGAPQPASHQEDTTEDMWLLYKVYQILLYCTDAPHLLPFLLPQTSHPHEVLGKVKTLLHALLPATTNVLFPL